MRLYKSLEGLAPNFLCSKRGNHPKPNTTDTVRVWAGGIRLFIPTCTCICLQRVAPLNQVQNPKGTEPSQITAARPNGSHSLKSRAWSQDKTPTSTWVFQSVGRMTHLRRSRYLRPTSRQSSALKRSIVSACENIASRCNSRMFTYGYIVAVGTNNIQAPVR